MISDDEIELLLNDLLDVYGYDFTAYSRASIKRRIKRLFLLDKFADFAGFREKINNDRTYFKRFVEEITVNVTEMFRDIEFFKTLRQEVIPVLRTYPFIRIWVAGASTGEEVYSLAIMLHEEGLLNKSLLYATDINPQVLEKASSGMFPMHHMQQYSENYIASGGTGEFSMYYTAHYEHAKFDDLFRKKMIFSTHNLVSDSSFNEFQLILCRNVLIYFDKELQNRVFNLFNESMEALGFLGLGTKETLRFSSIAGTFRQISGKEKIYRKMK